MSVQRCLGTKNLGSTVLSRGLSCFDEGVNQVRKVFMCQERVGLEGMEV